jgi:hypothetical protein
MHSQNQKPLKLDGKFIEGKITRVNFFYCINFSISRNLFALTILRVEFWTFLFWLGPRALARGCNL